MSATSKHDPNFLPHDLPKPKDDGACNHLIGLTLPNIKLLATNGMIINPSQFTGTTVIYCYPRTGRPGQDPPGGNKFWDSIPGARGCTPESCHFRDSYAEYTALNITVFGLSTQDTEYQQEAATRLHLPFSLLSDVHYEFTEKLNLPTFEVDIEENGQINSTRLIKRLTLICVDNKIKHVFYPVFPPDTHADEVLKWIKENA